jgi:large subunit ribosomal protein L25
MEVGKLTVEVRAGTGKGISRKIRRDGLVPGVCYGHGLDKPVNIMVNPKALKGSLDPARGQNTIITVTLSDNGTARTTLTAMLWEWQVHPLRRNVTHVDLIAIDPERPIEVEVPVDFVGKAIGTVDGGQLHTVLRAIPVKCKPADIPTKFTVDVSSLAIGMALHVSDVTLPAGVEFAVPETYSIVSCVAPKAEKVAEEEALAVPGAEGAPVEGAAPAEGGDAAAKTEGAGGDKKAPEAKDDKKKKKE